MAAVAPPGAVATALRHVRYWKQARSASDTRPHRAVPVDGAHRSRSLTCILTADNDAALAHDNCTLLYQFDALSTRVTGDLRGTHNRTRLRPRIDAGGPLAGPPSRLGAQTTPHSAARRLRADPTVFERTLRLVSDYPRLLPVDRLHICSQGNAFLIF